MKVIAKLFRMILLSPRSRMVSGQKEETNITLSVKNGAIQKL